MVKQLTNIQQSNPGIFTATKDLTVDTIISMSHIVEAIHQEIAFSLPKRTDAKHNKDLWLSGFIYRKVREITLLTANILSPLLTKLDSAFFKSETNQNQHKLSAILNGIVGDHLKQTNSSLTIPMQFKFNGKSLSASDFNRLAKESNGKILILVHGSCMNDLLWRHKGHDHGEKLAEEMDLRAVYLSYNSGLHISENGQQLSTLIDSFSQHLTQPVKFSFLCHSMGGLVCRSACYYAEKQNKPWLKHLQKMIFLGTPHHGAPLEKMGNWIERLLKISRITAPLTRITGLRSAGITDLRYGYIVEQDWNRQNWVDQNWLEQDSLPAGQKQSVPLPKNVECFSIAATTNKKTNIINDRLIGDGLVTVWSALGFHKNKDLQLNFPVENQFVVRKVNHMALLSNADVYAKIKEWFLTSNK